MLPNNYRDWIDIAWRRRRIATIAGLTVFGVVALGTLLWPPLYSSNCQVLVQDNRAQLLVSPDLQGSNNPQNSAAVNNPVQEQDLNSERELITSLYLVRLALEGLPVPPAYEHRIGDGSCRRESGDPFAARGLSRAAQYSESQSAGRVGD